MEEHNYLKDKWARRLPIKSRQNLNRILNLAFYHKYDLIKVDETTGMLRFEKNDVQINVYSTTLTVTTELYHPKKGKTQLHRRLANDQNKFSLLSRIFEKPRLHTGKGYY